MNKKLFALILALTVVSSVILGAGATAAVTKVNAEVRSIIQVKVNGNPLIMKDAKGTLTPPLVYKNKIYVPADVLANSLGVAYDYDAKTGTVIIGERAGQGISFATACKYTYDSHGNTDDAGVSKDEAKLSIGDQTFKLGLYGNNPKEDEGFAPQLILNTGKRFQKLVFTAGAEKSGKCRVTVRDGTSYKDILLKEVPLTDGQLTDKIEVDIGASDVVSIRIVGDGDMKDDKIVVGDIYLK